MSNQGELYAEFEPTANEIVFGQKTLPNRPLTDKEKSEKKKILMKLVDQKLKFDLIKLLTARKQQQESSSENTSNIPPITNVPSIQNITTINNETNTMPSYYQSTQTTSEYVQQINWEPQYQNVWQPTMYPQPYANLVRPSANTPWLEQPNLEFRRIHQNRDQKPTSFNSRHIQNPNLVCPPIVFSNSTKVQPKGNMSTNISYDVREVTPILHKPQDKKISSSISVS